MLVSSMRASWPADAGNRRFSPTNR
jgi:hypothetical protein